MPETPIHDLAAAIRRTHDCAGRHVQAVAVHEQRGASVWRGTVHVFQVEHAETSRAYAWSVVDKKTQRRRFLAILGVPPIKSPADAVRAAMASGELT